MWQSAYQADGMPRDGASVAEFTDLPDLTTRARGDAGHRPQARPRLGIKLRITDVDGHRLTAFATDTLRGQLADLELRHRGRARCEDRIRHAKDAGLTNPSALLRPDRIWCALACELTAWQQLLAALAGQRRPPLGTQTKRLRHRLDTIPATLARGARQVRLQYARHDPWAELRAAAVTILATLDP